MIVNYQFFLWRFHRRPL